MQMKGLHLLLLQRDVYKRQILNEGQPAVDRYLDFLSKGCSEYSIDLLKGAGVDMTSKKPVEDAMEVFKGLLDRMEELTK